MIRIRNTVIALVLCLAIALGIVVAFAYSKEGEEDVKTYTNYSVDYADTATTATNTEGVTIDLSERIEFNTIVLHEDGDNVTNFEFFYRDENGDMIFFYRQDFIGEYRYCSFPSITTDRIEIKILDSRKAWEIGDVEIFNMGATYRDDFRVTAYAVCKTICTEGSIDAVHFRPITNVNLISSIYFTAEGEIYFYDEEINGKVMDGQEIFENALKNVRSVIQPGTDIVVTLLGQDRNGSGLSTPYIHDTAFDANRAQFVENAVEFCNKYELDGLSFDYEYPQDQEGWANMFLTCKELKEALPGKTMSVAIGPWDMRIFNIFDHSYLQYVDFVENMNYDLFDEYGYHGTFAFSAYREFAAYEFANDAFDNDPYMYTDKAQLNLGLPFYSRPVNKAGYWGEYKQYAEDLGKYGNIITNEYKEGDTYYDTHYNGYQMIYDKTVYAIDSGIGGVMVWHYACDVNSDSELSLWGAIEDAINSRK